MTTAQQLKRANRIITALYFIFTAIAIWPLGYYGLCKHEEYPMATGFLITWLFFLSAWWGTIGEQVHFHWEKSIRDNEGSEPIDKIFTEKTGTNAKERNH